MDDEFTEKYFCLFPEKRIEYVNKFSQSVKQQGLFNSRSGEAEVSTDDIIRLVRPDSWNENGNEERFWFSGDTSNFIPNFYRHLSNDRSVFIFYTYFVQKYCDI